MTIRGRGFSGIAASADVNPSEIFKLVSLGDIENAMKLCDPMAKSMKMSSSEFLARQCSERSYLIYRLSSESRQSAIEIAQSGGSFPTGLNASDLLSRNDLVHEDISEQFERAKNCVNLSRTSLKLGSPRPAREYQIIGRSVVHKLLLGRTACIIQTYLSQKLQESREPYAWAIANHRKAAKLFDEELAPPGPEGPLEKPDGAVDNVDEQKNFSNQRLKSVNAHMRLIAHLASDVARHVSKKTEGKALIQAAKGIMVNEIDSDAEKAYVEKVFSNTLKALQ